ncbi:MAG: YraN family protein [Lachnospiraceae bacterium]|nr:YraN family protein [Lachnospiraceae bacterium]
MNKRVVGSEYEALAVTYLQKQGIQILARNYRCRQGEIDIIGKENQYLLFVEVKYRKDLRAGYPAEAVTLTKQKRIYQTARYYLYENQMSEDTPIRFDVVAILGEEIQYIRNAF